MITDIVRQPAGLNLDVTPIFQRNWEALTRKCEVCSGADPECSWCHGSGRYYRYIINTGSSRSSKTYSLIDCYDIYGRTHKNKRLTVWRDTKTDCKKTIMNDAVKHFKSTGRYLESRFNKTESIFNYVTGCTFEIHGTDDETTVHGLNQDIAWLNEPYKISRAVADQIDQRTAEVLFIDWNPRMAHWIEDLSKDKRAIVIHSTVFDNPFCPPEQKTKILSYQPVKMCSVVVEELMTEKEANEYDVIINPLQLTEAQITELSRCRENEHKRSASEYNWSVYGRGEKAERPNRIFHFEEISLHDYQQLTCPVYYGCDFGSVDPWGILEAKYLDGCLYLRELNYESENIVRSRLTPTELQLVSSQDEGIVSWMFEKLAINKSRVIVCDNNRPTKIIALRNVGFDYSIAAQKLPGSIIDGIDLLNNLKVYYTSDSNNLKYEQENYSRQVDRYGIVLEEPEDIDNHLLDAARYIALFLQQQGNIRKI